MCIRDSIYNYDTYIPSTDQPIKLAVYGVINPNVDPANPVTDNIKVSTGPQGSLYYYDDNSAAGTLTVLTPPGWVPFTNCTSSSLSSRLEGDYTFNITPSINIPKTSSQGALLVDFPSQFVVPNKDLTCTTTNIAYSLSLSCTIFRNRVTITGQPKDYVGNLVFTVAGVDNPIDEVSTDFLFVRTYDGINKKVVQRSFKNLDPFTFSFTYPGPLIIVNDEEDIYVNRGTQTQDIYVSLDYPSQLNLTLKPTSSGLTILPYTLQIYVGDLTTTFRVSVPMNIPDGLYTITWATIGDTIPPLYTPVRKTQVHVTKLTGLPIYMDPFNTIPFGGWSLPFVLRLDNGPDIGLTVIVNFQTTYNGLALSSRRVEFNAGEVSKNFSVNSSTNITGAFVTGGNIILSLDGVNKDIYTLPTTSVPFTTSSNDTTKPEIINVLKLNTTKTTASIFIKVSEPCLIYYMNALSGTETPTFQEVKSRGPPKLNTTRSMYGNALVDANFKVTLNLTKLVAQTEYSLFLYLEDRGYITNSFIYNFTTSDRSAAADFSLRFLQSTLTPVERKIAREAVAFVLALQADQVVEKKYNIQTSNTRLLQDITALTRATTVLSLQIVENPYSDVYPSPRQVALILNNRTSQLSARLSTLDTSIQVTAADFVAYKPSFPNSPYINDVGNNWVEIAGQLDNYGWMFSVAGLANETTAVPRSFQVWMGLNRSNYALKFGSTEVTQPYSINKFRIEGLEYNTSYYAFVVGGSAQPGFPDLMDDIKVVTLTFKTLLGPRKPHLIIDFSIKAVVPGVFIAIIMILLSL
eukprot:TRINITY_DN8937_c0_g1_i4.p1 TRINITY_DN8937_c0_g1~~TRINITY_DN8937_c0_g1_i4.p1  ORF type:complete len:821 (+),score=149.40 TRINITY_DN8937_c0_g1_i4:60-2465(+)